MNSNFTISDTDQSCVSILETKRSPQEKGLISGPKQAGLDLRTRLWSQWIASQVETQPIINRTEGKTCGSVGVGIAALTQNPGLGPEEQF